MDDQTTGNGTTLKVSISAKDSEKTKVGNWSCTQKPPEPAWDETGDRSKTFLIRNRVYEVRKCLSDNSGEAQVYLVESEGQSYVLKVYYPNFTADKQLMKVIANMNFEMIVRLYDYGKVCVNGKNRDFELMEFLGGGTLGSCQAKGDMDRFRRIALQAAAAIAYCHNCGVIHKDIKPGNLFFRDKEKTQVVLADFGISSVLKHGETVLRTTQARTPAYAAPEMYNDVIDGEVEITPAVDYYSLGMTLLAVWTGAKSIGADERNMMKRKSEGRLPGVQELPERVKMIVMGLTAVSPASRWTYNEVERWFEGDSPKVDIASPWLRYKSFVVDPERNLVADNIQELVPMLMDNERIACEYLYGDRLVNWLEISGSTKLSTIVRDIVKNRYPFDRKAGLMAAVYTMDPAYPYRDIHGQLCDNVQGVVMSMMKYADEYAVTLRNPNDPLWIYIETHSKCNVGRLRGYFKEDGSSPLVPVVRCAYELNPDLPFIPDCPSSSVKEIVSAFGREMFEEDTWRSLCDGRFLSWMYVHEDAMACESLRILTEGKPYSRQLAYKVLYNADRDAAYDLKGADTPVKVGELLSAQMKDWQRLDECELAERLAEYTDKDGRFHYFARLHGWFGQVAALDRCFEVDSGENKERLGAYDLRTAVYRACRELGAVPCYRLSDGVELRDGRAVPGKCLPEVRTELRLGCFSQWLSVFYHEDPSQTFAREYSYERMLVKWIEALGGLDAQHKYYTRFVKAKELTKKKCDEVKASYAKAKRNNRLLSTVFLCLCAVWLVLLYAYGIANRSFVLSHAFLAVGAPLGCATAAIAVSRGFFRGYGFAMLCLLALLGASTSLIPIVILQQFAHSSDVVFEFVVTAITVAYMAIWFASGYHGDRCGDKSLLADVLDGDVKSNLIEPLYYTFKTKSFRFKGTKFNLLDGVRDRLRSISNEMAVRHVVWCLLVGTVILEMVLFHPRLANMKAPEARLLEVNPEIIHQIIQQTSE